MVVHEKKVGSSDLPSLCFQLTSPHCPVTRESSARKDDDVVMAKESGTKRGRKGKTVMTRISIPRALWPLSKGGSFRGRTYLLPVSTEYTVHRACNVPLSADPTDFHTCARTHTRARNTRSPRVGVCPMICSSAIMPLAGTLCFTVSPVLS